MDENNRKDGQSTTLFSITERKTSIQIVRVHMNVVPRSIGNTNNGTEN